MVIAVDFDGTCVKHAYPDVGPENPGAAEVLRELVAAGHHLILYTMRSGKTLVDAIAWCSANGIQLLDANTNPRQAEWTDSPKVYAHLYIDDAALGCPLVCPPGERPYVDWERARAQLVAEGWLAR